MNTIKKHKKVLLFSIFLIGIFTVIIGTTVPPDDFLMHVTFGKWIIQNKEIPSVGIGSWYAVENNITYTFHEWLAGVIDVGYENYLVFHWGNGYR